MGGGGLSQPADGGQHERAFAGSRAAFADGTDERSLARQNRAGLPAVRHDGDAFSGAAARSGQKAGGGSGTRGPVATRRDEGDAEAGLGQAADWSGWRRPIVKRDILEMKQELDESVARVFTNDASRRGRVGQASCLSPVGNARREGIQRQAGSLSYAGR